MDSYTSRWNGRRGLRSPAPLNGHSVMLTDKGLGAAAVIRNSDGHVLLVKHTYGRLNWELPGGVVERNESPSDGAIREVREETGLEVRIDALTGYYYEPSEDRLHFVFACTGNGDSPVPNSTEISECLYWSFDQLPRPISDFTILRIRDAIEGTELPLPAIVPPREWLE